MNTTWLAIKNNTLNLSLQHKNDLRRFKITALKKTYEKSTLKHFEMFPSLNDFELQMLPTKILICTLKIF